MMKRQRKILPPLMWHNVTPDQTPPTPASVKYLVNGPYMEIISVDYFKMSIFVKPFYS
jgi:hypothetical protein